MIVVFVWGRYKKLYDVITIMILLLPPAILFGDQISDLLGTQSVKKGHRKDLPVVPILLGVPCHQL